MSAKKSTFNNWAVTIMMVLIIAAFALTGVTSFTNTGNSVAVVDDKEVSVRDYNNQLQASIRRYEQFSGGKALTQKQIRSLGLREQTLRQLVEQKLMLKFAEGLRFDAGKLAVKDAIVNNYAGFKTNGKFDLKKYKTILRSNGLQIKDFERDMIDQVKVLKLGELIQGMQPSNTFIQERAKFEDNKAVVNAVSIDKESMTKNLSVSKKEIADFLKEDKAKAVIDSLYNDYLSSTPQTKDKKPKSKESMTNELAKSHLQKTKREDLATFNQNLQEKVKAAFEKNNWSAVEKLKKKYGIIYETGKKVSILNPSIPGVNLDADKITPLFMNKNTSEVILEETPLSITVAKITSFTTEAPKDEKAKEYRDSRLKNDLVSYVSQEAMEYQREKSKVTQTGVHLRQ